jgi:hypothetical protein
MADQPLHRRRDEDLEAALRRLGGDLEWPEPTLGPGGPDLASRVRARLVATPPPRPTTRWSWRPARRGVVLALLALLALAAVAGAVGLGLPGLRLLLGAGPGVVPGTPPPTVEPSRTAAPGPLGSTLGLGTLVPVEDLEARAAFPIRLPADPLLGPPEAAYVDRGGSAQVAMVWASKPDLPASLEPGIGAVLVQFRADLSDQYFTKLLGGGTTIERVSVGGERGFWISGAAHFYFYESGGEIIEDTRRWVGDALIWARDGITYRLEVSTGRDTAIRIGESLE